jgi:hypothetical protein
VEESGNKIIFLFCSYGTIPARDYNRSRAFEYICSILSTVLLKLTACLGYIYRSVFLN